jgi:hypothetical protein
MSTQAQKDMTTIQSLQSQVDDLQTTLQGTLAQRVDPERVANIVTQAVQPHIRGLKDELKDLLSRSLEKYADDMKTWVQSHLDTSVLAIPSASNQV